MKTILVNKQIGGSWWDEGITADWIRDELNSFDEDKKIRLSIDSPGGSVWECVSIFNTIRDFMRENPEVEIETYIQGMAASSASVIALAAKSVRKSSKIVVEDNSVYMIHNAWSVVMGNHNDMDKESDLLQKIDAMMRDTYCKVSGKDEKTVRKMMDDESYIFGKAIVDEGFADECLSSDGDTSETAKDALFAQVKMSVNKTMSELKREREKASFDRCAAMLGNYEPKAQKNNKPAEILAGEMEDTSMTVEELKAKEPALYAEIMNAGMKAGVEKERSRCSAHLKMGKAAGCMDVAAEYITSGAAVADDDVQATYFEKKVALAQATARVQDNPTVVATPEAATAAEDNEKAMMAAFDEAVGGN